MMSNTMFCPQCQCKCLVLPWSCIYDADSRLKGIGIEEHPEFVNMTNSFILIGSEEKNGILGQECFEKLCTAIKMAQSSANDYNEEHIEDENSQDPEERDFWYYLEDKWEMMLKNMHFQNMYASYLMYYYYITGSASSQSKQDGDVTSRRFGDKNEGAGSVNISLKESKEKAATQLSIAKSHSAMFKRLFLDKSPELYCRKKDDQCGCGKRTCGTCGLTETPMRKARPKTVAL